MAKTLAFWFRRKYQLPPTDLRFLAMTQEALAAEYWAHYYVENKVADEVEDDEFDLEAELSRMQADDWEDINLDRH